MKSLLIYIFLFITFNGAASATPMPWVCHARIHEEIEVLIEEDSRLIPIVVVIPHSTNDYSIQSYSKAIHDAFNQIEVGSLDNKCHSTEFFIEYNISTWPMFAVWRYEDPETQLKTTCAYTCQDLKWEDQLPTTSPGEIDASAAAKPLAEYLMEKAKNLTGELLFRLY